MERSDRERLLFLPVGGSLLRTSQRALLGVRSAGRGQGACPDDGGGLRCIVRVGPHPLEAVLRRQSHPVGAQIEESSKRVEPGRFQVLCYTNSLSPL